MEDVSTLAEGVRAGDRRALARALTRVEDGSRAVVRQLVQDLHAHTGGAHLVGVTGSPGVGKSTLVSALVGEWRARDRTVAVLAIDPSSPFTGGALLGDRVRMGEHVLDPGVFVRSMASRGHLGGLSWAAPQALTVLDAAGFDVVLLETVGVGQAEVEVASVADSTLVVLAPGMGDAIQAAKAGILEVADAFCVNKADRDGADRTVRELQDMQRLGGHDAPEVPVLRTVAAKGEGIAEVVDALETHRSSLASGDGLQARQRARARLQIRELAVEAVSRRFEGDDTEALPALAEAVQRRELDPYAAADRLLERVSVVAD
jgi:LAO/AO transport system kinase